jgi:hypothetical protein
MSSQELFVRDPREVPFLNEQVQKILALAQNSSHCIPVSEEDDFGFMAINFLYKQIQHAESVLLLVPRHDSGLVARTMIEGFYQLLWAFQEPQERGKLWRSFSIIRDWRLIQERLKEGIPVDASDIRTNEACLKEFGSLHRLKKPKQNSADQYNRTWRGGVSLSDMAEVVGRELYDIPYSELSDWEHWGVSGIGDSISRVNEQIITDANSERVAGLSLLAAFQSLFQMLEIVIVHLSLNITEALEELLKEFMDTMSSYREQMAHPKF